MRRRLIGRLLSLVVGIGLAPLAWAMTPAGTVIENQASAVVAGGERYFSNIIRTVVREVCIPELIPDGTPSAPGQVQTLGPQGYATFPYFLKNGGNAAFLFELVVQVAAASEWQPEEAKLFLDLNRDGAVNPGEPEVTRFSLASGAQSNLLLRVKAPAGAQGNLYITPVARCPDGRSDDENYALARVVSGPALAVEKHVSPPKVAPGGVVSVELRVRNLGDMATGGEVVLSDDFSALAGVSFVSGSAHAPKGTIEYWDGDAWSASEPDEVKGLRLRLAGLDVGEEALLTFRLRVEPGHFPAELVNVARAIGPGGPAEARAVFEVIPVYAHFLGPLGNPRALPGGEGSKDDRQSAFLFETRWSCFGHTLENAGNTEDVYDLTFEGLPSGFWGRLERLDGSPLQAVALLSPGERLDFRFCLRPPEGASAVPGFTVVLQATSRATGGTNRTWDEVLKVLPAEGLELDKRVNPSGPVHAGSLLTYVLRVRNGLETDLTDVTIVEPLSRYVIYLSSDPPGDYDADTHTLTWRLGTLAAGGVWSAEVKVRVRNDAPDDVRVANRFSLASRELLDPVNSQPVVTPIWSSQILLKKDVTPKRVRIGERLNYTLTLSNPSRVRVLLDLVDYPDPHLRYVPGSGQPVEPEVQDGRLVWPKVGLEPGESKVFTYTMRVLPGAPERLVNRARAQGTSEGGTPLATGWAYARVLLWHPVLQRPHGTLVGRVFLDENRNGLYEKDVDIPLPGARVVLSDGRQAVTDIEGRYAFRELAPGAWLVRLDARSAPFDPLPHPAAMGDGYTHRVRVFGLTVDDFPLRAPKGWIRGVRTTWLRMGPLVLEKRLLPLGEGRYRVVLHLVASAPLPDFELRDPLPQGGVRRFRFRILEGERTLTYDLPAPAWLTDPEVRWRYP